MGRLVKLQAWLGDASSRLHRAWTGGPGMMSPVQAGSALPRSNILKSWIAKVAHTVPGHWKATRWGWKWKQGRWRPA